MWFFFTGLALTEVFVVFQSRSDWVALPLLLFPLTHPICMVSTGRILQTREKFVVFSFFFPKCGLWKPHIEKTQKEDIKKSVTFPKPTGVLDPAGVPRILCIMGDTYFCILFSWSKLGTPYSCSVQTEHPSASSPPGFRICAQPTWARSFNPQSGILGTFLRKWIVTQLVCVTFSIPW